MHARPKHKKTQAQGNINKGKNTKQAQEQENLPRWIISIANAIPICFLSYASDGNSFQKAHTSLGQFCSVVKSIGSWVWFPEKSTYLLQVRSLTPVGTCAGGNQLMCVSLPLLSTFFFFKAHNWLNKQGWQKTSHLILNQSCYNHLQSSKYQTANYSKF